MSPSRLKVSDTLLSKRRELLITSERKSVLRAPREQLIDKADLEEDTVDNLLAILRAEFED